MSRERQRDLLPAELLDQFGDERLEDGVEVLVDHERRLDVDLRELGLTVGAQVLVTEAAGELVVAVAPPHHQELLEELRALRQRVQRPAPDAARHEIVAGALGRRAREDRRLDLGEAVRLEVRAHARHDQRASREDLLHALAPQVEVAVAESDLGSGLGVLVRVEGRHLGLGQDLEPSRLDLDLACRHLGVHGFGGTLEDLPLRADHPLRTNLLRRLEEARVEVSAEGDLGQAVAVAEQHEEDAALRADGVHPAGERDVCADLGRSKGAAGMGSVGGLHGLGSRVEPQRVAVETLAAHPFSRGERYPARGCAASSPFSCSRS